MSASTLRSAGRYTDAMAAWDRAIGADVGANRDQFLARRAICQAALGDHAGASSSARAAMARKPEFTEVWYDAACALALCGPAALRDARLPTGRRRELAGRYAGEALDLLRRAAANHMFTSLQMNLHQLETDRDLDSLRSRPDFQHLVAEQQALEHRLRAAPDR
jgi:tetratricopeptide (TPR) repeat protein